MTLLFRHVPAGWDMRHIPLIDRHQPLFWLIGLDIGEGGLSPNLFWAHVTDGNFLRFTEVTDSPVAQT